jgi:hypothetical protein
MADNGGTLSLHVAVLGLIVFDEPRRASPWCLENGSGKTEKLQNWTSAKGEASAGPLSLKR